MATAFISSTSRDLADYREAAIEICNQCQIIPLAMEFFEAMGAGASAGSTRAVDRADVYIGLFAYRYGYIEAGFDRSVTELEFDRAWSRKLEQLCFLVKPGYPWPPDAIDYEQHAALRAFKQKIEKTLIRQEFTTVDDFKAKLILALTRWQERHAAAPVNAPAVTAALFRLPPRPSLVVGRSADLSELRRRLGLGTGKVADPLTIVRGWPGVGKTTLINALAHDPEIATTYPDGVLWATLGDQPSVDGQLIAWRARLGGGHSAPPATLAQLIDEVRARLQQRRMLLLVDDAWGSDAALPFKQVAGAQCALLLTTRFRDVANAVADLPAENVWVLSVLTDAAGIELLTRLAPSVVKRYPDKLRNLVRDLEGLPLALRVAGRLLEGEAELGVDVEPLIDDIRDSHLLLEQVAPDDRFEPHTGTTPTISLLLQRSTNLLDAATREHFAMLGAFAPKPATFDLEALSFVWEVPDPLPSVRRLVDRGLLEPIVSQGRFQLHALLVMHAQTLLSE